MRTPTPGSIPYACFPCRLPLLRKGLLSFLLVFLLAVVPLATGLCGESPAPAPAPAPAPVRGNVVLIVADDHGLDTGAYGNPVVKTPALDRLASEGTLFTHAFCTTASCSPSRSVILTGRHNHATGQYGLAHGTHHFVAMDGLRTLPVILSDVGYRTAIVGKLHVNPEAAYRFDRTIPANSRNAVEMAERSRTFLAEDPARPFFLYFCPTDPHRSGSTVDYLPGKPDRFGNRPAGQEPPGVVPVRYEARDVLVPSWLPDTVESRAEWAQYLESVSRLDQGVGRLLDILRDAGLLETTLVIYISDNGPPFPGAKTTLYEPGIRLPCIVRHPRQARRGLRTSAMVTWADIAPSILEFAGVSKEAAVFHGRSFLGVLESEAPEGWDEVFASHTFHEVTMYYPMRAIRTRTHKLIWNIADGLSFPFASDLYDSASWQGALRRGDAVWGRRGVEAYLKRPRFELYALEQDPDETRNLAGDPGSAELLEGLKTRLREFQRRTQDPWLIKWTHE